MRIVAVLLMLVSSACLDEDTRTLAVDTTEVVVPRGADREVGVMVDGVPLVSRDLFSWYVEDPEIASVALTAEASRVTITGLVEGETVIHLGYATATFAIPTYVMPPAP